MLDWVVAHPEEAYMLLEVEGARSGERWLDASRKEVMRVDPKAWTDYELKRLWLTFLAYEAAGHHVIEEMRRLDPVLAERREKS